MGGLGGFAPQPAAHPVIGEGATVLQKACWLSPTATPFLSLFSWVFSVKYRLIFRQRSYLVINKSFEV